MKLYATIKSERAMKGQGGNKEIVLSLKNESKLTIASLLFIPNNDDATCSLILKSYDKLLIDFIDFPNGKRQKGEKCYCSDDDMSIPHYH
jgi:hypothetical protein